MDRYSLSGSPRWSAGATCRCGRGSLLVFQDAVKGEASFVFWIAVDPSMEALRETSCFAQSRKQMLRFTLGARD